MKILHISVEADNGWLIAQGLEEPALITQARTFDALLKNIREVVELLGIDDKDLHIELIVPPSVQHRRKSAARKRRPSASAPRRNRVREVVV